MLSDPDELLVYESDGLTLFRALADFVVFPTTAEQVSALVKLANREGMPFVARGAGTGLSGGCLPAEGGLVISLMRMNRILEVDYDNQIAVVEPGLVNLHLSWAVGPQGFYYAPDPSSQQACTIGGNIANNSGGPHTLKYGVTTNHVLGLEVVLPDGEIMWLGGKTRDPQGYDLLGLFVGSEGTFGIATKIAVRILRKPQAVKTVLAVFDDGRPGLGGRLRHHRARPHSRRDGDDRQDHDPGRRGRLRLRLSARRGGRAPDRARRPRRRHGGAGRARRRGLPRRGRPRGARGARRGGAPGALARAASRRSAPTAASRPPTW